VVMTGTGSDGIFLFFSQASPSTNTVHVTTWCTWHDNTISHTSLPSKYFQYAGASIKITSGGNDLRKCGVINGMYMMYLNIHAIMYSYVYCICIIYTYIHTHSIHIYIHNHTHSIHTHIYIYTQYRNISWCISCAALYLRTNSNSRDHVQLQLTEFP
jgi:hypothetical protein